jgi:hypothetical protein
MGRGTPGRGDLVRTPLQRVPVRPAGTLAGLDPRERLRVAGTVGREAAGRVAAMKHAAQQLAETELAVHRNPGSMDVLGPAATVGLW